MKDVAILTPTFTKPELCAAHVDSIMKSTDRADVFLSCAWDDPELAAYIELFDHTMLHIGPHMMFGPAVNALWRAHPGYKYYMWGSDDMVADSTGWLDALVGAILLHPDKIAVAWPDDQLGHPHRRARELARFPLVSSEFLEALGWFCIPGVHHWYLDDAMTFIADSLNRTRYCPMARVRHEHKPAPMPQWWSSAKDESSYRDWLSKQSQFDLARLRAVMRGDG